MSLNTLVRDAIVRDERADRVVRAGVPGEDGAGLTEDTRTCDRVYWQLVDVCARVDLRGEIACA